MTVVVETYPDSATLAAAAADRLIGAIHDAITRRGQALIVLTGGGTGIALLEHVRANSAAVDWSRVQLFWGDDRYVPENDTERNEKQGREALIDHIDIPARNVHAMPAADGEFGADIDAAARAYADVLAACAEDGEQTPAFDVHLLGMGPEGHVNSLFPHSAAVLESERPVVGVEDSPKPPPRRITLTLPSIRRARQVWFAVSGEAKADAVAAALAGAEAVDVPAAGAVGTEATVWLLDTDAASRLEDVAMDEKPANRSVGDRIRTLTDAALNVDATVDQLDSLITAMDTTMTGMGGTMEAFEKTLLVMNSAMTRVDDLLDEVSPRLVEMLGRLEVIIGKVERVVGVAETAMIPLSVTESAVRSVVNVVRRGH